MDVEVIRERRTLIHERLHSMLDLGVPEVEAVNRGFDELDKLLIEVMIGVVNDGKRE